MPDSPGGGRARFWNCKADARRCTGSSHEAPEAAATVLRKVRRVSFTDIPQSQGSAGCTSPYGAPGRKRCQILVTVNRRTPPVTHEPVWTSAPRRNRELEDGADQIPPPIASR